MSERVQPGSSLGRAGGAGCRMDDERQGWAGLGWAGLGWAGLGRAGRQMERALIEQGEGGFRRGMLRE